MSATPEQFDAARAALAGLDPLLQHPIRLGICVLLADADRMSFSRLKELLGATDGNLGAQLRRLEDAGYLSVRKAFVKRKPVSWYILAADGRRALEAHLAAMQALIDSAELDSPTAGR